MKILILNSGSSSIKFQLFDMDINLSLASGLIEQIGENNSNTIIQFKDINNKDCKIKKNMTIPNHKFGLEIINKLLIKSKIIKDICQLDGVGHRIVHGGEKFLQPIIIDKNVIKEIKQLIPLAPLHNQSNLEGITSLIEHCPNIIQVGVFDTAFHSTIPQYAYMYPLPYESYQKYRVRKYGFHGTSHSYIIKKASKYLKKDKINAITLHLGNGASIAAIKDNKSIDTSMGLTPLEGLMMGTRCGDIDPAIIFYLLKVQNLSIDKIDTMLNKQSGLKGICGNKDIREIDKMITKGDLKAKLAIDMFCYKIKKYIGSYIAVLGSVDCLVFTGGIGENSSNIRKKSCDGLKNIGINIDDKINNTNQKDIFEISPKNNPIKILVIPTNEELEIALQTKSLILENL